MFSSGLVAFNPNDTTQQTFLAALALGETGGAPNAATEGVGGTNLSSASTDQYGFPQWSGAGTSHAAGLFQFQPGTWDSIASQFDLNFQNVGDQEAGAWDLAQQTYATNTGGGSLESDLQAGNYSRIQSALSSIWPSVSGNAAAPQGLAGSLAAGTGAPLSFPGAAPAISSDGSSSGASSSSGSGGGLISDIENWFLRFGLIVIGGIVIVIALWALLSQTGAVPSPAKAAKAVLASG